MSQFPTQKSIATFLEKAHEEGKTIGLVTGCFDILHIGHVKLLQFAAAKADLLVVGVEHDETIKRAKGVNRPVNIHAHRMHILAELRSVAHVFLNDEVYDYGTKAATQIHKSILSVISPDFVVTNPSKDVTLIQKRKQLAEMGIKLIEYKNIGNQSSTKLLDKIIRLENLN